jgi:hypothetical protein
MLELILYELYMYIALYMNVICLLNMKLQSLTFPTIYAHINQ